MRQFDVFENPRAAARTFAPYGVVLSSHHIAGFDDAVIAPLVNDSLATVGGLEIEVRIGGEPLLLVVSDLIGVEGRNLQKRVASLSHYEDDIRRALDRLFTGF